MTIFTPATSANLGPGFDSLGLALKLYNEVSITEQKISSINIIGEGSDKIALKKNNTFVNIFNETIASLNGKSLNYKFNFVNNIPFSRGLGSSSSVIVGAIAAAYYIAGFKVERSVILDKALQYESHPDNISPAVWGGFTVNIVSGDSVFTQRTDIDSNLKAVVVIPDEPMNTKQSRGKLPANYTMSECVSNLSHAAYLSSCFIKKDYDNLQTSLPVIIVDEGKFVKNNVQLTKQTNAYYLDVLRGQGCDELKKTLVLTVDGDGKVYFQQAGKSYQIFHLGWKERLW
jgi:homoserine kinase